MAVRIESQAEPIPGYKLIERLGGGGFGEVWKAEAPGGLHKAIKFVYGDLQTASEDGQRAEQELKAMSRVKAVRHPYILSLERYDIIEGQLIIVMELADRNLWDRFREHRAQGLTGIPREELLRYMEEAAEALDLMNIEHQLQHLDIKPQNLFLVHNHAKVADFGLVKDLEGMMASVTGGVTPVYAAPETFDGWVSRFCDQYSLAIVYQELLTGQRPFNGTNVRQLIMQHLQAAPNLSSLPPGDQLTIGRALSKNPDHRFPTCRELVQCLRAAQGFNSVPSERPQVRAPETRPPATVEPDTGREEGCDTGKLPERRAAQSSAPADAAISKDASWIRIHPDYKPPPKPGMTDTPVPKIVHGEGFLFPAVVVGLGLHGLRVMIRLREQLEEEFGRLDVLPHLRWLYIDTDPECVRLATASSTAAALRASEVLLAKLNRPRHYLRANNGRPSVESWFDTKMLYRIPRSLMTLGMRALGRLAFIDNYRAITRRLQAELQACAEPEVLTAAAEATGLGVRTNQPKVYVVTGLAGGTGGGMFLDMAYVLRRLFKQARYEKPEIIGNFLLPATDRQSNCTLPLGNTFAALTELNHFSMPGTTFSARYEEKEKAFSIKAAPYDRCVLLETPRGAGEIQMSDAVDASADLIRRELTTPLGRIAEKCRADQAQPGPDAAGLHCQVFGVHRVSWPKRALTRSAASRLCRQLVARWASKDAAPLKDAVQSAIVELLAKHQLDGEHMMNRLQVACEQAVGKSMDEAIAEAISPLTGIETQAPHDQFVCLGAALDGIELLLGRADGTAGVRLGKLAEPLTSISDLLIGRWVQKLTEFAFSLVEQPKYRLAGAEEAVRQITNSIEQTLLHHECLAKDLVSRAEEAHLRIAQLLSNVQLAPQVKGRADAVIARLVELLTAYPKWRLQSLILQRVTAIFISLRGRLTDQLREINYCRARLVELQRNFDKVSLRAAGSEQHSGGREIFPAGCQTLEDAVGMLSEVVSQSKLPELDASVQKLIQDNFIGLAHVCMSSTNMLDSVQSAMQKEAQSFIDDCLATYDLAEMYLAHVGGDTQAEDDLASAFDEAAPPFTGRGSAQHAKLNILVVPGGSPGQRVVDIARTALPDIELATTTGGNEIVFYREISQLPVSGLEQLGPHAYEAYTQISSVEHFTPHSRTDILEWRVATAS